MVNIRYNVVVNTNTVDKQANTYTHTHISNHWVKLIILYEWISIW